MPHIDQLPPTLCLIWYACVTLKRLFFLNFSDRTINIAPSQYLRYFSFRFTFGDCKDQTPMISVFLNPPK